MLNRTIAAAFVMTAALTHAQEPASPTAIGDAMIARYFELETKKLADRCLADITTLEDWESKRGEYRRELFEMLGLDPLPPRTDLKATITGVVDHPEFTVEKIHFQSRPHLYVTANLYIPKGLTKPAPAILYLCGHGRVAKGNISYGNKTYYQHHGAWFARNGYVCMILDSLQLGEIEGIHHGTYRYDMWWWLSRGYTPAGVEAWNCIRALDYLQTRPEVDGEKLGATGRSGGGAYSWWIAALDDRIKAAVPVAGITDLHNHVIDSTVEGHCDCMFINNTYRWDYPMVAALVAPRPLLISNSDKDNIFPLEGVVRTHEKVRRIYKLYGAEKNLGLHITEGPHEDTQELRVHAYVWFNRFLKGETDKNRSVVNDPGDKPFEVEQLKVFDELPADQINTKIHDTFVPKAATPELPKDAAEWAAMRDTWRSRLREKVLRGWPTDDEAGPLNVKKVYDQTRQGMRLAIHEFDSQPGVRLRLYVIHREGLTKAESVMVRVADSADWEHSRAAGRVAFADAFDDEPMPPANEEFFTGYRDAVAQSSAIYLTILPRGEGRFAWNADKKKQVQHRRRFMLLGQTLEGMQAWDIRRGLQAARTLEGAASLPMTLSAGESVAEAAVYAAAFEPGNIHIHLDELATAADRPAAFLNAAQVVDIDPVMALAADRHRIMLRGTATAWPFAAAMQGKGLLGGGIAFVE